MIGDGIVENIETKFVCPNTDSFHAIIQLAKDNDAKYVHTLYQKDLYYHTLNGRLKLRQWSDENGNSEAELIGYLRRDDKEKRLSNYYILKIENAHMLNQILSLTLTTDAIVEKERVLYILASTRIHFDKVLSLGLYIELETVLPDAPSSSQRKKLLLEHEQVIDILNLGGFQTLSGSYQNLVNSSHRG